MDQQLLDRLVGDADPARDAALVAGSSAEARWRFVQVTSELRPTARRPSRRIGIAVTLGSAAALLAAALGVVSSPAGPRRSPAAAVLDEAAAAAVHQVDQLGPGQFLFTETQSEYQTTLYEPSTGTGLLTEVATAQAAETEQAWTTSSGVGRTTWIDGTPQYPSAADRAAWADSGQGVQPPAAGGWAAAGFPGSSSGSTDDVQSPVDVSDLPVHPGSLAQVLAAGRLGTGRLALQGADAVFERAARLLVGPTVGMTPSLASALLRIMAEEPGVQLLGTVTDHEGQTGTGIAMPSVVHAGVNEVVVDPSTGVLLEADFALPGHTLAHAHSKVCTTGRGATVTPRGSRPTGGGTGGATSPPSTECSTVVARSALVVAPLWTDVVAAGVVGSDTTTVPVAVGGPLTASLVPGAPTGATATAVPGQVSLRWTAPPAGGSPITDYVVRYYEGASTSGGSWTLDTHSTAPGYDVAATANPAMVVPGQRYTFTVEAENADGYGLPSAPATVTVPG